MSGSGQGPRRAAHARLLRHRPGQGQPGRLGRVQAGRFHGRGRRRAPRVRASA
jgi:hypothetical protein